MNMILIKNNYLYKNIKLICIFLIILFLFYFINNMNKENKEHYLTFFIPYYDNEKDKIQQFYENEDYKRLNYKKNFFYKPINFGYYIKEKKYIIQNIAKMLLANSKIKYCNDIEFKYDMDLIKNLNNNNIQLSIKSIPAIAYYNSNKTKEDDPTNVKLVLKISKRYVFFITRKNNKIESLTSIPFKSKIGVNKYMLSEKEKINFVAFDILDYLKYQINIDYTLIPYDTIFDGGEALINNELDLLIWIDYFPNKNITKFFNDNSYHGLKILPFNIPQEKVFKKINYQYDIDYIDLNNVSKSYLPVRIKNENWNKFKPDMKILSFDEYLVTNRFVDKDIIYNITNSYFKNIKLLKNNNFEYINFISDVELDNKQVPIPYHEGAREYYFDNGYMSNNPSQNCKYLVGVMNCNDKTLLDNNLD